MHEPLLNHFKLVYRFFSLAKNVEFMLPKAVAAAGGMVSKPRLGPGLLCKSQVQKYKLSHGSHGFRRFTRCHFQGLSGCSPEWRSESLYIEHLCTSLYNLYHLCIFFALFCEHFSAFIELPWKKTGQKAAPSSLRRRRAGVLEELTGRLRRLGNSSLFVCWILWDGHGWPSRPGLQGSGVFECLLYILWLKQCHVYHPWLGMVYATYNNADDWGMVYYWSFKGFKSKWNVRFRLVSTHLANVKFRWEATTVRMTRALESWSLAHRPGWPDEFWYQHVPNWYYT